MEILENRRLLIVLISSEERKNKLKFKSENEGSHIGSGDLQALSFNPIVIIMNVYIVYLVVHIVYVLVQ